MLETVRSSYNLSVLSGDNAREAASLRILMGSSATLKFEQQPADKLDYIIALQRIGEKVLMIGDGLNDAGALKQSNTGISVAESTNNFTPASDGIIEAQQLKLLPAFIRLCKASKRIVLISFVMSLTYNIIGLYFAVQAMLSPLVAAVLMPASSVSIILLTFTLSELYGKRLAATASAGMPDKNHVCD
jgi:Cu+-exporting ATPase